MENFRKLAKIAALDREILGPVCGNPDCEDLCAEAYDAALSLRLDPAETIRKIIERELHCLPADTGDGRACRFGFIPFSDSLALGGEKKKKEDNELIHIFRTGVNECKKCQALEGTKISSDVWADEEKMKSKGFRKQKNGEYLPHPNCKCHWEEKAKKSEGKHQNENNNNRWEIIPEEIYNLLRGLKNIWENKIPKPPRSTDHSGSWSKLTWMWFFEEGPNPIRFDESSPYSRDIANSCSIQAEVKAYYKKHNKMPPGWNFTGPKTATGELGEVEWFLGSYRIENVRTDTRGIHFTVYNVSSWHSGTRLPKSWTDFIRTNTGFEIYDLVTSAPRGETLKIKLRSLIPNYLLQIQWVSDILAHLPSFGGDWTQYYDVVVKWDD